MQSGGEANALFSRLRHAVGIHVKPPSTVSMCFAMSQATWYRKYFLQHLDWFFFLFISFLVCDVHLWHKHTDRVGNQVPKPNEQQQQRRREKQLHIFSVLQVLDGWYALCERQFQVCFINEMSKNINNNLNSGYLSRKTSSDSMIYIACIPCHARFNTLLMKSHSVHFTDKVEKKNKEKNNNNINGILHSLEAYGEMTSTHRTTELRNSQYDSSNKRKKVSSMNAVWLKYSNIRTHWWLRLNPISRS